MDGKGDGHAPAQLPWRAGGSLADPTMNPKSRVPAGGLDGARRGDGGEGGGLEVTRGEWWRRGTPEETALKMKRAWYNGRRLAVDDFLFPSGMDCWEAAVACD